MANVHSFAASYSEARDKFLAAARVAGATTYRYDNPRKGPKGEALSTDVARLGPDDASRVVVTISRTHGVEGYCGSGFQANWLASAAALATVMFCRAASRMAGCEGSISVISGWSRV